MSWCSPVLPRSSRHIQGLAPKLFLTPQMQAGAAVNIFFLGKKKNLPKFWLGARTEGLRAGETAWIPVKLPRQSPWRALLPIQSWRCSIISCLCISAQDGSGILLC